jgi:hypothetical protein
LNWMKKSKGHFFPFVPRRFFFFLGDYHNYLRLSERIEGGLRIPLSTVLCCFFFLLHSFDARPEFASFAPVSQRHKQSNTFRTTHFPSS